MSTKKTRLAFVGCGKVSNEHVARFAQHSDRLEVVATVDIEAASARHAADVIGAKKAITDYREVLSEVDAVLLALPHDLHHSVGLECLNAGKHVLMEKPLALNESECEDLIAASEKNGALLMVAYCMRFHPLVERMKQIIADQTYGETFQVSIWTEQYTRRDPDNWMCRAATLGGGQFFSHGCHYVDLLLWFLGEPVRGTHIGTRLGTPWMEKEGTSNVCLEFENGALGYHMGTWGARGTKLKNSMHVHCTEGMLELGPGQQHLYLHRGALEEESGAVQLLAEAEPGKPMEREMEHFLDCIETGNPPLTNARDSLRGLQIIWKLYEAEQNNLVADLRGMGLGS